MVEILILITLALISCSNKDVTYEPTSRVDPYAVYEEAYTALRKEIIFMQKKNFRSGIEL